MGEMILEKPEILWLAEYAVEIRFYTSFCEELTSLLTSGKTWLEQNPTIDIEEVVITYQCLTVFYKPLAVIENEIYRKRTAFEIMKDYLQSIPWDSFQEKPLLNQKKVIVPVKYGSADLDLLSDILSLRPKEIIDIHQAHFYTVYMVGFLPGFPYMGTLPSTLEVERKETPSLLIEAGSVAIAGRQTGIYSQDSPGGWYVLGKTDISLIDKSRRPASFFNTGDQVLFKAV